MIAHGKEIKVFCGNSNPAFAKGVCDELGLHLGLSEVKKFADGEVSVSVNETVRGCDVFVVQSTCNPVNDNLMELLIMMDAFRRASAGRITAVMPLLWLCPSGPESERPGPHLRQAGGQHDCCRWGRPGADYGPPRGADPGFL